MISYNRDVYKRQVYYADSEQDLKQAILDKKIEAGVMIPENFSRDMSLKKSSPDAGGAAAHRAELSQAQADAPCAGHGAGGGAFGGAIRRGRDKGAHRRAAARLHQEAGYGRAAGAVQEVSKASVPTI